MLNSSARGTRTGKEGRMDERKESRVLQYLSSTVEHSYNKHGHEEDGYALSPEVVGPVGWCVWVHMSETVCE